LCDTRIVDLTRRCKPLVFAFLWLIAEWQTADWNIAQSADRLAAAAAAAAAVAACDDIRADSAAKWADWLTHEAVVDEQASAPSLLLLLLLLLLAVLRCASFGLTQQFAASYIARWYCTYVRVYTHPSPWEISLRENFTLYAPFQYLRDGLRGNCPVFVQ